jgi:hypothetical protein
MTGRYSEVFSFIVCEKGESAGPSMHILLVVVVRFPMGIVGFTTSKHHWVVFEWHFIIVSHARMCFVLLVPGEVAGKAAFPANNIFIPEYMYIHNPVE